MSPRPHAEGTQTRGAGPGASNPRTLRAPECECGGQGCSCGGAPTGGALSSPPPPPLALGAAWPLLVIKGRQGPGFGRRSRLDGGGGEGVVEREDPLRVPLPKLPVPVRSPVSQMGPRRLAELLRHRRLDQGPSGHPAAWEGSLDRAPLFPSAGAGAAPQGQGRSKAPTRATPGCGAHRVSASERPGHLALPCQLFSSLAAVRPLMALLP